MIGQTLGRYRIVQRLGEGGAGVVYLAEDPRLERNVALKILREDALRDEAARTRFRGEARVLARLLHPNVATLFDLDAADGRDFLVMEYVGGETLASLLAEGPLPERRARVIGIEIAQALAAAHEQGIVHRDLKPSNVLLTPRGHAKVLDFGLAHIIAPGDVSTTRSGSTGASLIGTIPYMAPEQIRADHVDARTDLYALGTLLFEMTAGSRTFPEAELVRLMYRIVNDAAPTLRSVKPGVSEELERLVARCLEKAPDRRYATAEAVIRALRGDDSENRARVDATARAAPPAATADAHAGGRIRALAVLPFENRSGDPEQEFFADGMTDALITDLAQIGALRVISRTSAMRFKGTRSSLPQIARELNVDAVVEGSALRAVNQVRISVQLVDAASDSSLWAKSYDRDLADVLSLQREVTRAIAEEIRIQLTPEEQSRLKPRGPVNPAAHVAYLQGRFLWNRWDTESLKQSITYFEQALAADPSYALAYAGLADSYSVLGNTNAMPPNVAYPLSIAAAERGLALDPNVAELHASLAYVQRFYVWDWPRVERGFLRALEINPGYGTGRRWYAQFLSAMGRHDEAIAEAERALELDPLSLIIHTAVGDVLFFARRYERAIYYYRRCVEMDPTFRPGHTDLSRALEFTGAIDEAIAEFLRGTGAETGAPAASAALATLLVRAGRRAEAADMIARVEARATSQYVSPYGIASYYATAGDNARALDWLERAYAERDGALPLMKVHPRLDVLHGEPRFRELLAKMQLDN